MNDSQPTFLGAGRTNVVVSLPTADVPSASPSLHTFAATSRVVLRIRSAPQKECVECYNALKAYAGSRNVVTVGPALYRSIEAVVPLKYKELMKGATEAIIVPNFTSDPAQLLRMDVAADEASDGAVSYTVEVKPKGAWQQPQVVGIVVDGATYWIAEAKHHHCRYMQMQCFKEVRDTVASASSHIHTESESSLRPSYCPNYLFSASLSSREGLQRLVCSPQNNLKVIRYHSTGVPSSGGGDSRMLTVAQLHGIADAIDVSGVLMPLSHLQLCGCAPPAKTDPQDVAAAKRLPVLDVELLYRWSLAKNKDAVEWLVLPGDPAAHCSCITVDVNRKALNISDARRVHPMLDYQTCVDRFFVSTTAKDVSLLITVSSRCGEPDASTPCSHLTDVPAEIGGVFVQRGTDLYRVGVVDMDDKKHKKLEHYYLHDKRIVEAFLKKNRRQ